MHDVIELLKRIAPTNASVLIQGETGTGKELVAQAIHQNSPRKNKPFVALNCAALSENILESELFGHVKGAFTDASTDRVGKFEYAHGGTLFLDEVGDMPLATQIKLLRVLENGEITRVGSNEPIKVNVRILSATNRNLEEAIAAGTFRSDLYHRLKVVTVVLPRLVERSQDIPLLIEHFIKQFAKRHDKPIKSMSTAARRRLMAFDWPGNVRQLRNVVESMVVVDYDGVLDVDDLPAELAGARRSRRRAEPPATQPGEPGRQAAGGDRAAVHRRDAAADRRQPRRGRRNARHRRADAVSEDQGIRTVGAAESDALRERCGVSCRRSVASAARVNVTAISSERTRMPTIRQLSASVINKIAAGEVIERPASVVKELVENALDAGATRIEVALEQGGVELVRVVDNGGGIAADELPLAVASHATSKLVDADDLFRVRTLGFRGEALASIAEVSRFTIRSRTADDRRRPSWKWSPARSARSPPAAVRCGTTIEVRNLFFNTPVRRKFLRSTQTEMGHVTEAFTRLALAHPQVHFTLRHNGRVVHDLPPSADWRERIGRFFGRELADESDLGRKRGRADPAGRLRRPSQPEPRQRPDAVPVPQRPAHSRSLAAARAGRGVSRAAADGPLSDLVPVLRHAAAKWST